MRKLIFTEINTEGIILSNSVSSTRKLENFMFSNGDNIFNIDTPQTKLLLHTLIDDAIRLKIPIEISIIIKSYQFLLTAHCINKEKIFIYWKPLYSLNANNPVENDWGFDELPLQEVPKDANGDDLKRFTDNLPLVVFEIFLYPDGRFEFGFVNEEMYSFFPGFNREAVNADNSLLFIRVHPEDKQQLLDSIRNVFKLNVWEIEYRIIEDGKTRWVKGYGRPEVGSGGDRITVCTYLQDITEKKLISERLELVDFTFRNATTAINLVKQDGSFYDFNDATCKMLGYSKEEYSHLKINDVDPKYKKVNWADRWEDLKKMTGGITVYGNKIKKDGTLIETESKINFIKFGELELACGFINDITEKKKLDEKLSLVDYAFRKAKLPIYILRADGSIYDFNEVAYTTLGYSEEEFINLTVFDLSLRHNKESWKDRWEELKIGIDVQGNTKLYKRDKTIIDIEFRANVIKYEQNELCIMSFFDVTEKGKVDNKLKLVDFAFRNAKIPMYFTEIDGKIFDFNEEACHTLGYNEEEFRNLYIYDISLKHTPATWKLRWEVLKSEHSTPNLTKLRKKDHTIIDAEMRTNIINYGDREISVTSFIDITEKKKIDEQLKIVDFTFSNVNTAIVFSKEDGTLYTHNKAFRDLYGYTETEMKSLTMYNFGTGFTDDSWKAYWNRLKQEGSIRFITKRAKKDGTLIDVEINANYIKLGNLEVNCAFVYDITEKNKIEKELKKSNERYEYATLATSDVIWETDIINDILYLGNNFTEVFGLPTSGIEYGPNNIWRNNLHPEDLEMVLENERVVIEGKMDKWESEYRLKKGDGEYSIVLDRGFGVKDEHGNTIRLIGAMQDITEKKAIQEALKKSNERYENATLASSDVVWESDLINNTIYISKNFTLFFGHEVEEGMVPIENNIWRQNVHPDDLSRVLSSEYDVHGYSNNIWREEYRLRKADGSYAVVQDRSFAIKDEKGKVVRIIGSMHDITEKKLIEQELIKSNLRYEYATLATSDVIWEADLVNKTYYSSVSFTELFGHKSGVYEELENNSWTQNVHPDDLEAVLNKTNNAVANNEESWKSEYRFKKLNGEYEYILDRVLSVKDKDGTIVRLVGALQIITESKLREERLSLLETVVTNTTDAVIIRDFKRLETGGLPILYVNEAFTNMTGYSLNEALGKTLKFLNGPITDRIERNKVREAIHNMEPGYMEVINYKKDGTPFWASISVFPVKNASAEVTHWVSIQRDITQKKLAEEEREHLINELIENNKELKQFGYITTHNLRAPLTNLISICRLLDTNKIEDTRTVRLIDGFKQSTFLLNETLNDLIDILIIKENRNLPTKELGFGDILNNVINSIENTINNAGATIEIDFSIAPFVEFSNTYLESIFLNLLTNSIKYASPLRKPIIKIVSNINAEGKITLTFSDNGIGMNKNLVKERIFGLYQRFHNNADSKGIGLYLIHSQINALGGSIDFETAENIGTTFTITFK